MKLSSFDLNHARALHHLLEEAHVTRAARKLGITPAACSNALQRLRVDFRDPLLVRAGRAMVRTPRAEELREPARAMMLAAARLFERGRPFDPSTESWEIYVTTSDRVAELVLPALDRALTSRAPKAVLTMRTLTTDVGAFLRELGGIAIVPDIAKERDLRSELLFVDEFVCAMRRDHALAKGRWSLQRLAQFEHVLVAPLGKSRRGGFDLLLEKEGLARPITRVVTTFSLALPLVAQANRVAILPRTFAQVHAKASGLALRPLAVAMPSIEMLLAWHVGHEEDPKHLWLRGVVRDVVHSLGLAPK